MQDDLLLRTTKPCRKGQRSLLGKRKRKSELPKDEAGAAAGSSEEKPGAPLKYETI